MSFTPRTERENIAVHYGYWLGRYEHELMSNDDASAIVAEAHAFLADQERIAAAEPDYHWQADDIHQIDAARAFLAYVAEQAAIVAAYA